MSRKMSFFGTLRKVRKGKKPGEHSYEETLQKIQEDSNNPKMSFSSSTPNLNKVLQAQGGSSHNNPRSRKLNQRHPSSSSVMTLATTDDDEDNDSHSTGTDSVETTSTASVENYKRKTSTKKTLRFNFSTGKLTNFVAKTKNLKTSANIYSPASTPVLYHKSSLHFNDIDENEAVHSSWNSVEEEGEEEDDSSILGREERSLPRRNSSGSVQINMRSWKERAEREASSLIRKSDDERRRDELLVQGVKKFNRDSKRGMDFFLKKGFVGETAKDHAEFLMKTENLSKTMIGNYLGEYDQFNQKVLEEFVLAHDFEGEILDASLRRFLASFRLPGEAQKIDRMMEAFAGHYCAQNPDVFSHSDTCYLLSFALIMLNTTLHNPNVKDKTTLERFIAMNRDIDSGNTLDPQLLSSLFESIRKKEFEIPKEDANTELKLTFLNSEMKGWLWKQGAKYKNWTRRWFVLNNNCLYYFMHQKDKVPRSIIPLENIHATEMKTHGKYFIFTLTKGSTSFGSDSVNIKSCKTLSDGSIVLGSHSEFVLGAETPLEREEWVMAIQQNSSFDQCYTLLQEKKKKMNDLQSKKILRDKSGKNITKQKSVIRKSQISMPVSRPKTQDVREFSFSNHSSIDLDAENAEGDCLPPNYASDNENYEGDDDALSLPRPPDDNDLLLLASQNDCLSLPLPPPPDSNEVFGSETGPPASVNCRSSVSGAEDDNNNCDAVSTCDSDIASNSEIQDNEKLEVPFICVSKERSSQDSIQFPIIISPSAIDPSQFKSSVCPAENGNENLETSERETDTEILPSPLLLSSDSSNSISFSSTADGSIESTDVLLSAPTTPYQEHLQIKIPQLQFPIPPGSSGSIYPEVVNESPDITEYSVPVPDQDLMQDETKSASKVVIKHDEISLRDHRLSTSERSSVVDVILDFAATTTSSVC